MNKGSGYQVRFLRSSNTIHLLFWMILVTGVISGIIIYLLLFTRPPGIDQVIRVLPVLSQDIHQHFQSGRPSGARGGGSSGRSDESLPGSRRYRPDRPKGEGDENPTYPGGGGRENQPTQREREELPPEPENVHLSGIIRVLPGS